MPDWSWPDFEWDDGNAEHIIARHNVSPDEAEQVFHNGAHVRRAGDRHYVYGQADSGRYLYIVCEQRKSAVRVVTARDMTNKERRSYARRH